MMALHMNMQDDKVFIVITS